ncbi:uncharacterized protein B0H18DRAFT_1112325 [Fomitopsis serialis]|uniref:uncharacterized protein n=1 Tax=Fomitopsis serialis TaxID=139415 RepID=UPI002008BA83|nr:uncharacterized protein B0H18DRAFT_1112325 [Neoantrodia serialis]KAH9938144.1 hypothetical protein B0H18DRAFT_1112325 [Neoantrodia serialis]
MATTQQVMRAKLAAAADRRLPVNRPASAGALYKNHDDGHPRRQELRKMIDKGILECNSLAVALRALTTMKTIAENIVKHPHEEKYKKIKRSNPSFMQAVVEPKGLSSSSSRQLGFREKAMDYQTYLVFHRQHMPDLKVGLTLLGEAIEREMPKREREERALELAKAEEIAAKEKAMKHIMDDRKTVQKRTLIETATRTRARGSVPPPAPVTHSPSVQPFVGEGRTLEGL